MGTVLLRTFDALYIVTYQRTVFPSAFAVQRAVICSLRDSRDVAWVIIYGV
jgi:hypothetical protein